jgi:hypothetical protein
MKRKHERKMAGQGAYGRNERGPRSESKPGRDVRVIGRIGRLRKDSTARNRDWEMPKGRK